jgi:ParB family chromosome partitioning protein
MAHVKNNSGKEEWYTPAEFIESARFVMESIDIDPASCETANKIVKAITFYNKENDGLIPFWYGNIWLNPPYGSNKIKAFIEKLESEVYAEHVSQFVTLTNNATETQWAQRLISIANAICFPSSRVKFLDEQLNPVNAPLQGQMICYRGKHVKIFVDEFRKFGKTFILS